MEIKPDLKYTETHEWVKVDGDIAIIGISDFAQEQLGDIVFVEFPEIGESFDKGSEAASIESSKAVGELKMPISGEIVEVNGSLEDAPETVNSSPYGDGWMLKVKMSDKSELDSLLDATKYKEIAQ